MVAYIGVGCDSVIRVLAAQAKTLGSTHSGI